MAKYLMFIFLCLIAESLSGQHLSADAVIPEKRDTWIENNALSISSMTPQDSCPELIQEIISADDYYRIRVRSGTEGRLTLGKNQWIIFRSTSSHDHPETGDITLAIDHKGRIFTNSGHVCGGIIHFETGKIKKLRNTRQFFRYFVSDTDGERWRVFKKSLVIGH